jgi:hypothetical protein
MKHARLPAVMDDKSLVQHMHAYASMLGKLPHLGLNGDCARQHLVQKHLVLTMARLKDAGKSINWRAVSITTMQGWCPDLAGYAQYLKGMMAGRLAERLGTPPEYIAMWCCLWREALKLPNARELLADPQRLEKALVKYRKRYLISPAPAELVAFSTRGNGDTAGSEAFSDDAA